MELLRLKRQLKTAQRGYKLLKEKRDGLMKKFMEIIREAKAKRADLEKAFSIAGKEFALSTSNFYEKEIEEFFASPSSKVEVSMETENVMSVLIPKFSHKITGDFKCYSDFSAPLPMEKSLKDFWNALELMIVLAGIEHSARLLSFEIERTRRRVNALEYVIIPEVKKGIKFISSKLDEQERSEKIIRMKIKDMITA